MAAESRPLVQEVQQGLVVLQLEPVVRSCEYSR